MSERQRAGRWRTGQQSKQRIVQAARERFMREGYRRATVRAIAADAGVDVAMVYYFFGNKEGLFTAVSVAGPEHPRIASMAAQPRMRISAAIALVLLAASVASNTSAPAHADCGDPGQGPCTGPVPTVDQVVAIMAELTDPDKPAASKTDIVTPGFTPEEVGVIDNHLHRMDGHSLPLNFIVADIRPAPNNFAGATLSTTGDFHQWSPPGPIELVEQGGHWLLTHQSAMSALDAYWYNANKFIHVLPHG